MAMSIGMGVLIFFVGAPVAVIAVVLWRQKQQAANAAALAAYGNAMGINWEQQRSREDLEGALLAR
jgi:hypothetical protein